MKLSEIRTVTAFISLAFIIITGQTTRLGEQSVFSALTLLFIFTTLVMSIVLYVKNYRQTKKLEYVEYAYSTLWIFLLLFIANNYYFSWITRN